MSHGVILLQLRETVFQFTQKELAPKADEIDKTDSFLGLRVSVIKQSSYWSGLGVILVI